MVIRGVHCDSNSPMTMHIPRFFLRMMNNALTLEFGGEADVNLAACEVVGHGVLNAVDVGYPVVAAHVGDVEDIENVDAYPGFFEVAQECAPFALGRAYELVG